VAHKYITWERIDMKFVIAFLQWGTGDEFSLTEVDAKTPRGAIIKARKLTAIRGCNARVRDETGQIVGFFMGSNSRGSR